MSDYEISTDPARLDVVLIHRWLSEKSYWAKSVPRRIVERAIANSMTFAAHHRNDGQVGFARVITDKATSLTSPTWCSCSRRIAAKVSRSK